MNKFPETYNLPRLNYEETENQNKTITSKKIKSEIRNLLERHNPRPDGFIG